MIKTVNVYGFHINVKIDSEVFENNKLFLSKSTFSMPQFVGFNSIKNSQIESISRISKLVYDAASSFRE